MNLDPENVPESLVPLLGIAEKWGIADDFDRDSAIADASRGELEKLIHSIDNISDEELYGWLSGEESFNPRPTPEYLAFSCLTMSIDLARVKNQKNNC